MTGSVFLTSGRRPFYASLFTFFHTPKKLLRKVHRMYHVKKGPFRRSVVTELYPCGKRQQVFFLTNEIATQYRCVDLGWAPGFKVDGLKNASRSYLSSSPPRPSPAPPSPRRPPAGGRGPPPTWPSSSSLPQGTPSWTRPPARQTWTGPTGAPSPVTPSPVTPSSVPEAAVVASGWPGTGTGRAPRGRWLLGKNKLGEKKPFCHPRFPKKKVLPTKKSTTAVIFVWR